MQIKKQLLYIQVKEDILKKIRENFYKAGERLPSEPQLAKELNISRPTLREALKMLQREGVLVSKNGVGTYVNSKTSIIENPLSKLQSLGEMIKNAGFKDSESDIRIYLREAELEWKEKLSIDEKVLVLERTRTADGSKVAFYYNVIPMSISRDKFEHGFSGGILDFLERNLGIKVAYSITEICSINKTREMDKKAIEILGFDILLLKQLHFDENNKPVFYSLDFLKNEVFRLFIRRE